MQNKELKRTYGKLIKLKKKIQKMLQQQTNVKEAEKDRDFDIGYITARGKSMIK